jgi:hypothetical protein
MRRLQLEYRRDDRVQRFCGGLLLLVTLVLIAWMSLSFYQLQRETFRVRDLVGKIESRLRPPAPAMVTVADARAMAEEIKLANQVVHQLNLPWDALLSDLEGMNTEDVALLGIEPDSRKGVLKVNGEARDFPALLEYLKALRESKVVNGIYLLNHQVDEQNPDKPLRFLLEASWISKR